MDDSGFVASASLSQSTASLENRHIYPGKLKQIVLKNFMCHDHFEIELNPNINFITGRNGSGKSAIAAALVLGFGQRATSTNRGVAVKDFIKRGKKLATIELTVYNFGSDHAYTHYGSEVTVIRKISDNGGSVYKIRGETGPEENLNRHDLDNFLLQFNIQPHNPLCVLTQDTARSFFKTTDPKQLYKLFMQGTQLETVRLTHEKNREQLRSLKKEHKIKEMELNKVYQDVLEADKIAEISKKLEDAENRKMALENEQAWALVGQWEVKLQQCSEKLNEAVSESEAFHSSQLNDGGTVESTSEVKRNLENELVKFNAELEKVDLDVSLITDTIGKNLELLKLRKSSIEYNTNKISTEDNNIIQLQNAIEKIRSVNSQSFEYKKNIDAVVEKIMEIDAVIKTTETHHAQLDNTLREYSHQYDQIKEDLRGKEMKLREFNNKLQQVKEGDSLGIYGNWMPELIRKIDTAFRNGKFRERPRGPLGQYIKVKDKKWIPAVETLIKSFLSLFCVSCVEDNKVLSRLIDETVHGGRKPDISISRFFHVVHNTNGKDCRTNQFCNLLDGLSISDPVVANCLIDQMNIEQILMVPTTDEALDLMEMEQNVPERCKFAFTLGGDCVYPAPNYRFYGGILRSGVNILQTDVTEQIRDLEMERSNCKADIARFEKCKVVSLTKMDSVQRDFNKSQQDLANLKLKKKRLVDKKFELEKNFEFEPSSIDMYNQEIEQIENKKCEISKMNEKLQNDVTEINTILDESKRKRNALNNKKTEINKKIHSLVLQIQEHEKTLKQWNRRKDDFKRQVEQRRNRVQELRISFEEVNNALGVHKANATKTGLARLDDVRDLETIRAELKRIVNHIKIYEKETGGNTQQNNDRYKKKKRLFSEKQLALEQLNQGIKKTEMVVNRDLQNYDKINKYQTRLAKMTFTNLLKIRNFKGSLEFNFDEKTLNVVVVPNASGGADGKKPAALSSLSGGERSYSTTAFIRAIWSSMTAPFYVLDEFDVFTDLSNRTQILQLLVDQAKSNPHYQYLFITPLDLSRIDTNDEMISLHRIQNPRDNE